MTSIPRFGIRRPDLVYRPRPGAYAIVFDADGRVAFVEEETGLHLPGGGLERGETPEEALVREVREECGCGVRIVRAVGQAFEFVDASKSGPIEVHAHFFRAEFVGTPTNLWLDAADVAKRAARLWHAWAIEAARE